MKINEIFKGIQGEGPLNGMPCLFVRLSGCNLNCDFCDTKYHTEGEYFQTNDILNKIRSYDLQNIVFTGGEPLLQMNRIVEVMDFLPKNNFYLETNGTIYNERVDRFDLISCSPKKQATKDLASLVKYNGEIKSIFKFVYENKDDLWWEDVIQKVGINKNKVFIMPEGATRDEQFKKMPEVMEYCLDKGFNFSPRLHVLAYDTRRGV